MNFLLNYSSCRVRSRISGAVPFKTSLNKEVLDMEFKKKAMSYKALLALCKDLDHELVPYKNIYEYFFDNKISIGPKRFVQKELDRVISMGGQKINSFVLGFPFKCPVPVKTNFHKEPDLGELMFLYRLGNIARHITKNTKYQLVITILEETNSLSRVFKVDSSECQLVQKRLNKYLKLLEIQKFVQIQPLYKVLGFTLDQYHRRFDQLLFEIKKNKKSFSNALNEILPTIALSVNKNNCSLNECRKYLRENFNRSISPTSDPELFETAYRYIAFSQIQKESDFRQQISKSLQLTLCPKKGRIGIRPTISSVKILPHHGVPVVLVRKSKIRFTILYYIDLIAQFAANQIIEVTDHAGKFLYYEIIKEKKISKHMINL